MVSFCQTSGETSRTLVPLLLLHAAASSESKRSGGGESNKASNDMDNRNVVVCDNGTGVTTLIVSTFLIQSSILSFDPLNDQNLLILSTERLQIGFHFK